MECKILEFARYSFNFHLSIVVHGDYVFRRTRTTLSPLRNILETKRSLLTGFFPFPFGASVHISLTFSSTYARSGVSLRVVVMETLN